jgi:hypothetical protein
MLGPQGDKGLPGPTGHSGWQITNQTGVIFKEDDVTAFCTLGTKVLSGGPDRNGTGVQIIGSAPTPSDDGWTIDVLNLNQQNIAHATVTAVCANVS